MKPSLFYFQNFWLKLRYSSFLRIFFDALARIGIRISPYYLFLETISPQHLPERPAGFEDYEMGFWGVKEIKAMTAIPGRPFSEEFLLQRLNSGHLCLGLKKDNHLAAFTWCNLAEAAFKYYHFPLKEDEAYLYDAYTLVDYRGKGLAPFLRYHLYKELEKRGRKWLYSYSDCFNSSAVRFKQKINAKKEKLFLTIQLFGRWRVNYTLKDYRK